MMGKRERHIRQLAEQLNTDLQLLEAPDAVAGDSPYGRASTLGWVKVWGWSPLRPLAYWVALHELGHCALGHIDSDVAWKERYMIRQVAAEAEAWLWAIEHAQEPLTSPVREFILGEALGSYVAALRDDWRTPEAAEVRAIVEGAV